MIAVVSQMKGKSEENMSKFVEGRVVGKRCWTERLYSLQVDAEVAPFQAGQFTKLALTINGEVVGHPYSFVNSPDQTPLEFYFIQMPGGLLTERLAMLEVGDAVLVAPNGAGFLTLSEVPEARYLWLLSTGTGIGPFLSILKTEESWQRFDQIVLVHAVRHVNELAYSETIHEFMRQHGEQFHFVPFVSRAETDFALRARIPAAIADGRLEARAGVVLAPESSQVMLCGNPNMLHDTIEALLVRGLKKNRRHDPGHITLESYW
jgi:ferredoxin/flavodoxin---NADP+ reductase